MKLPRRPLLLAIALGLAAISVAVSLKPEAAAAHPLGNFTINHYTRIEVSPDGIGVYRVLDMAEIPAFQERQRIDTDGDGAVSALETSVWAAAKSRELVDGMRLSLDGDAVRLDPDSQSATYLEGQGGLVTIRLVATYTADASVDLASMPQVEFEDTNYGDRLGWREIVVRGLPGVDITGTGAFEADLSNELRSYPAGQLSSPLDVRSATFSYSPGTGTGAPETTHPQQEVATRGNPDGTLSRFTDLIAEKELSAGFIAIALITAMAFGAIHALSPGHGKTIVAAYLVGSRGTLRHAALLGVTVTITHTSSVYALGFVTLYLSQYIVPEDLYPWMSLLSGAIIVVMGLSLLVSRLRASGLVTMPFARLRVASERGALVLPGAVTSEASQTHEHSHGDHPHEHDDADRAGREHTGDDQAARSMHKHGFGSAHAHAIPGADGEPVTWQRLLGLGIFGGMIPCPSAIVVMLSAIALHRVGLGLVLILAFSIGLAVVLTGIGFAVVWAQRIPFFQRAMDRADRSTGLLAVAVRVLPVVAAVLVTAAGVVITSRAAGQF